MFEIVRYFRDETVSAKRLRKPAEKLYHYQLWQTCWVKYWMQEFFCDLFGVLTTGPAFAWSHYHLCVKRGGDPFETTLVFESTHPADGARMRAALMMLTMIGYEPAAKQIGEVWQDFVQAMDYNSTPEYNQCYPEPLICKVVAAAKEGIEGIGVITSTPNTQPPIVSLLNSAWKKFWSAPEDYPTWEAEQFDSLRSTVNAT